MRKVSFFVRTQSWLNCRLDTPQGIEVGRCQEKNTKLLENFLFPCATHAFVIESYYNKTKLNL